MAGQEGLRRFPTDFKFGAATAAYQIEGGWNSDGKGENIWDRLTHTEPNVILDCSNADIAADSYHLYKEDVAMLKSLGVDFYRFSISWSRILPVGSVEKINQPGVEYYNNLINELISNNIEPVATLYHWDLPQPLQELGGWLNFHIAQFFVEYAQVCFRLFGDRVKSWITFNEPTHICRSYCLKGFKAPNLDVRHLGGWYLALDTILKAHALVYHMYDVEFREIQGGKIGISLHSFWYENKTNLKEDIQAANEVIQFSLGLYAHPIFSKTGDYPPVLKEIIDKKSRARGFNRSLLLPLNSKWIEMLKGSADFFGLNHYSTQLVSAGPSNEDLWTPDIDAVCEFDPSWPAGLSTHCKIVPWGLRKLLNWINKEYDGPEIIITENGYSDSGQLNDLGRIEYITSYLKELLKAIHLDKCKVVGYTVWSLIDNYEWTKGYTEKFGVFHVDFTEEPRRRIPKDSAGVYKKIIRTREVS